MAQPSRREELAESDWYALELGKLLANLRSLEFILRATVYERDTPSDRLLQEGSPLHDLKTGDLVPENYVTDYASLGEVIKRYNEKIATTDQEKINDSIVQLRDALAHGRISAPVTSPHFGLVKFGRPQAGQVQVTFSAQLTREWLKDQCRHVAAEILKAHALHQSRK